MITVDALLLAQARNTVAKELSILRTFISDELEVRRTSLLPDPDGIDTEYITEAEDALRIIDDLIAQEESN